MQRVGKTVSSVKCKALHIGQFNCVIYDAGSIGMLRRKIEISCNIKTHVKLSRDGWKDSGSGFFSRDKLKRMSVPLDDIECLIRDESSGDVLFCVFNLRPGSENARYSIVAYKIRDVALITKLCVLFSELRGEVVEEACDPDTGGVVMRRRTLNGDVPIMNISRPTSAASPLVRQNSCSSGVYLTIGAALNPADEDYEETKSIDHVFDDAFDGNMQDLSTKIYPSPGLLTILQDKQVLTDEQIEDIKAQKSEQQKSLRMMELLKKRSDSCFGNFLLALDRTGQGHISKFLRRGSMKRRASIATCTMNAAENHRPNSASMDRRSNRESVQRSVDLLRSIPGHASNSSLSYGHAGSQMSLTNQNAIVARTPKSILRSNAGTGSEFGSRSIAWSPSYESLSSRSHL